MSEAALVAILAAALHQSAHGPPSGSLGCSRSTAQLSRIFEAIALSTSCTTYQP